jgi:hypothetical protein
MGLIEYVFTQDQLSGLNEITSVKVLSKAKVFSKVGVPNFAPKRASGKMS